MAALAEKKNGKQQAQRKIQSRCRVRGTLAAEIAANVRTMTVLKASLDKRYKDNATGEWKSSSSLSRNEVGQAVLCLVHAQAAMMEKSADDEEVVTSE